MCAAAAQRRTARSRCDRARERVAAPRERRSPRRSRVSSSVLGMMRVLLAAWITASRHTVARKIPESPSVATACSASAHSALMSPSPTLHTRPALLLSADPLTVWPSSPHPLCSYAYPSPCAGGGRPRYRYRGYCGSSRVKSDLDQIKLSRLSRPMQPGRNHLWQFGGPQQQVQYSPYCIRRPQ